jgi:hypothetical protein
MPADEHDFTLPARRQTRRSDVRLHRREVADEQWRFVLGLPTTRPARMIADLLEDHIEPERVGQITAEVVQLGLDHPGTIATCIAPSAARYGFRRGDGIALFDHLLTLAKYPARAEAVEQARGRVYNVSRLPSIVPME